VPVERNPSELFDSCSVLDLIACITSGFNLGSIQTIASCVWLVSSDAGAVWFDPDGWTGPIFVEIALPVSDDFRYTSFSGKTGGFSSL